MARQNKHIFCTQISSKTNANCNHFHIKFNLNSCTLAHRSRMYLHVCARAAAAWYRTNFVLDWHSIADGGVAESRREDVPRINFKAAPLHICVGNRPLRIQQRNEAQLLNHFNRYHRWIRFSFWTRIHRWELRFCNLWQLMMCNFMSFELIFFHICSTIILNFVTRYIFFRHIFFFFVFFVLSNDGNRNNRIIRIF